MNEVMHLRSSDDMVIIQHKDEVLIDAIQFTDELIYDFRKGWCRF